MASQHPLVLPTGQWKLTISFSLVLFSPLFAHRVPFKPMVDDATVDAINWLANRMYRVVSFGYFTK